MQTDTARFDVAIIGSGIAGSTLGTILARQGLKVVLFEAGSHPKFAIGESMILETSEVMRSLAELYDVPELAYFSSENYFDHIGTSHGVKRHFSYLHHTEGQPLDRQRTLQAVIPKQPHGHELHLYRQDTDYFLMMTAVRYGVTVLQNTRIRSVEIDGEGVRLATEKGEFRAEHVVDAGGFRSLLAEQFGLRRHDLRTHSRAIFTHMVEVPCYHQASASKEAYGLPLLLSEGTLHHVFEGGWMWVIPFNNHARSTNPLCSVGLMLDPRVHPAQPELSPEEEFYQFVERFPGMAVQFRQAKAVREWTRTGRIQYSSKQVVGDRYCLLGQAAGFVDPLFSKGLYTALACTSVLADRLLAAKASGDYSAARFKPVETLTLAFIDANDRLVANAYKSFSDYRLWAPLSVLWLAGAYLELVKLTSSRALAADSHDYYKRLQQLQLVGGGFADFEQLSQRLYGLMSEVDPGDPERAAQVSQRMTDALQQAAWMPDAFRAVLQGKTHLPTHKLRPQLLRPKQGFLGEGDYRAHFFDDKSLQSLASFFIREKAKYSKPVLQLKRTARLLRRGLLPSPAFGTAAAIALMMGIGGLAGYTPRSLSQSPESAIAPAGELDKTVMGLVNLVNSPTDFKVACENYSAQVMTATVEGDRLVIEVMHTRSADSWRTTLTGSIDSQGIFEGIHQTDSGSVVGKARLRFDGDGSAQGSHGDRGRTLSIVRI